MAPLATDTIDRFKKHCPELRSLPKGWIFKVDTNQQVMFQNGEDKTYSHPTLGQLPQPWILKLMSDGEKGNIPLYYNPKTKKSTKQDPRFMPENLKRQASLVPESLKISATTTRNRTGLDIQHLKRNEIDRKMSLLPFYTIVKTIDDGAGGLGGMNGGVFVVVHKGTTSPLLIEKRFKPADVWFGKKEIEMMHKLRHPTLAAFVAGFILENKREPKLAAASVYIEFCNAGSMDDMIKSYRKQDGTRVPEAFVWHAFMGLADGLAYLYDGVSHIGKQGNVKPDPKWVSVLHRDIKPDNVLFRTRSTVGSKKYLYCILSDFGLACDDLPLNHPDVDQAHAQGGMCGTTAYLAPELCHHPYPESEESKEGQIQRRRFPPGRRHSAKSDVWALGTVIYNLCEARGNGAGHIDWDGAVAKGVPLKRWLFGTDSRKNPLTIPTKYTEKLNKSVQLATEWNPADRAGPVRLIETLDRYCTQAGHREQGRDFESLPEWAYRIHDYADLADKAIAKDART